MESMSTGSHSVISVLISSYCFGGQVYLYILVAIATL